MAGWDSRAFLWCLIAGFLASGSAFAAEPARTAKTKQREAVEAILAKPVEWTPEDAQSITIDAFIAHVREKHGLAIRWDSASVGLTVAGSEMLGGLRAAARSPLAVYNASAPSPYVQQYTTAVPDRLKGHVTYFAPSGETPPPVIDPNAKAVAPPEKLAPIVVEVQPAPVPADAPKPEAAAPREESEENDEEAPHRVLSSKPISPSAVALTGATVGDVLEQLLAAAAPPIMDTGESLGMPISIRALTLDYIIEGRTVVITTRLRANAMKETRVYRIAGLKGMPPEQVAKVICHSIRPWSWRSQASEIADRLATRFPKEGSFKLPPISVANQLMPGSIVTFSEALPQPVQQASGAAADPVSTNGPGQLVAVTGSQSSTIVGLAPAPPSPLPQQPGEVSMEELAKFGQMLTGGALAAFETVVNTVEIVHYGDPPTGVMEVLPGVLVITQSQGAHREIAEFLEELAAAGAP